MGAALDNLTIRGFKSIEALENFKLRKLNVLIGANGAGKSNFVEFFRMLRALAGGTVQGARGQGSGRVFTISIGAMESILKRVIDDRSQWTGERNVPSSVHKA